MRHEPYPAVYVLTCKCQLHSVPALQGSKPAYLAAGLHLSENSNSKAYAGNATPEHCLLHIAGIRASC